MAPRARMLTIALALFFVVAAGAVFFIIRKGVGGSLLKQTACDLLSLEEAKALLNDTAIKSEDANSIARETGDLKTTRCNYVTQGETPQEVWTLSLEVRVAKTDAGAAENASYFPPHETDGQQVTGYGDEALWNSYTGRLNVLKDDNYYLIRMVKGAGSGTTTLADVQKVAAAAGLKE